MSPISLVTTERSQDELHAPPRFVRRRIVGLGKPAVTKPQGEGLVALAKLDQQDWIEPPDADGTKENLEGILEKWSRYACVFQFKALSHSS